MVFFIGWASRSGVSRSAVRLVALASPSQKLGEDYLTAKTKVYKLFGKWLISNNSAQKQAMIAV